MDEMWSHHFDCETKLQGKAWNTTPQPVKFHKIASAGKVMASVFLDIEGVLMTGYLENGNTDMGSCYV